MRIFRDQLGLEIEIKDSPNRIISLVPSQTELLFDLGLESEVVGVTKFCIHPDSWFASKAKVGGTKNFWFDTIDELHPDLIIGNKEENYEKGITTLKEKYPVWMSDVISLGDALDMITSVGELVNKERKSRELVDQIRKRFTTIKKGRGMRALYLIWKKPWLAAGKNTFIDSMMESIGMTNCVDGQRYPELTIEGMQQLRPDLIMLSSEPFPFDQREVSQMQALFPASKIMLVNGEMFSWYGSRLVRTPDYLESVVSGF